jgi:two-component system chemotaxis response regulator CheY
MLGIASGFEETAGGAPMLMANVSRREAQARRQATQVGRLKVLVADGDPLSREGIAAALTELGHSFRTVADGAEALQKHVEEPAHVILSDWALPGGLDGAGLCRRVRESSTRGYTHFIFLTASEDKHEFLEKMRAGADDVLSKPIDRDTLEVRLQAAGRVAAVHRELVARSRTLERDSERLLVAAHTDPLTEAANRRHLDADLQGIVDRSKRYGHRYCAAFCDIDSFKSYNDSFGHLAGDEAIRLVSHTIQGQLRRGDGLYRYGGEEFLVLLPEQSLAGSKECMERIRAAVSSLPDGSEGGVLARCITISVGIAELLIKPGEDPVQSWLQRADAALYRAKAKGRNCVEAYVDL